MVQNAGVFDILTSKCPWRDSGVEYFDIETSKSGPKIMVCFVHFDLKMCFAPQRRTIFRYLNFQKWSKADVFCTFWLANVLRATAVRKFCASESPKVVRSRQFFSILSWKCASRFSGVQFFISPLNSYLRTRRFSKPTFRPSRPTKSHKSLNNTAFRDFPNISRVCIFFLLIFAQLYLLSSDSTSLLCFSSSDSTSLLCSAFSTVHTSIVGS